MINQHQTHRLTAEELEVRIWGFVVVAVTMILFVIVIALLYSVTFVTQPIKSMAPIDQAYTKMLNDIVLLVVGGIGGVMSKRAVGAAASAMSPPPPSIGSLSPQPVTSVTKDAPLPAYSPNNYNWMGFQNPALDESWTPPPPPTTPPNHQELDHEREALALARKEVE